MNTSFDIGVYVVRGIHMVKFDDLIKLLRKVDLAQSNNIGIDLGALADYLIKQKEGFK